VTIESMVPEEPTNETEATVTSESDESVAVETSTESKEPNGEPKAQAKDPQAAAMEAMGDFKVYQRGDMVDGTIVQVGEDSLIVDIGTKTEGIITRDEIGITGAATSRFSVGDTIMAIVISEDEEGSYQLSKRRADQTLVWDVVEDSIKNGTRITATGFRAIKGGLLVDIGTIAFLPQSLFDIRRVDDLEPFVGQSFEVRVVDFDRDSKPHPKIVVSRRAILEEDITKERDKVYDTIDSGSVVEGKVIKLTNYGAFIDVGGIQGLLHVSEMAIGRIKHPSEVMKEGDTIKVKILKVDKKKKRISLGRRELLPNPWEEVNRKFKQGSVVEGTIVRTTDFGAFVKLDDYFEGLAHISELVDNKISHAKEVFSAGDKVNVLIMNIDKKNKRIKLSVKRAADAQRQAEVDEFMKGQGDLGGVFGSKLLEIVESGAIEIDGAEKEAKKGASRAKIEKAEEVQEEKPEEKIEVQAEAADEVKAEAEAEETPEEETPEEAETEAEKDETEATA
jgi:4-hydroxy-3-methylbut-2-enyl diphosphate reductase